MKSYGPRVHGLNKHVRETVKRAKRRAKKRARRTGNAAALRERTNSEGNER